MSIDNRIELNAATSITGWTGDDSVTASTAAGDAYGASTGLTTQLSNSDEHMYTTSIGGTRDLSDAQVFNLIKDNLIETLANGGSQIVLHDGTDRIGYDTGGNDSTGLQLPGFFNSYRLDTSNLPASFATYAGSEGNLTLTAITGVGYGTIHTAKAVGSIDNVRIGRMAFVVNGNPALTINGGTSGTPEQLSDVVADDVTNGWGLVANPKASIFDIYCSTEWGDSGTADSYFEQVDSQLFFDGRGLGVGNFNMSLTGNATGTNSFVLTNCVCVCLGARANWDMTVVNFDIVALTSIQWAGFGTFDLPNVGETIVGQTWTDCGQIRQNGAVISDFSISDCVDTVAFVCDNDGSVSDGTITNCNRGISFSGAGPFTLDGVTLTGNTMDLQVNSASDVEVDLINGASAATIENIGVGDAAINPPAITISVTVQDEARNAIPDARVYLVLDASKTTEIINGAADASGLISANRPYTADEVVVGWARSHDLSGTDYETANLVGTISSSGLSITATLKETT